MIRVLHVVGCLERGGTESFIMNLYRNIDRSKIQFDFLVLHEKDYPYIEEIKELGGNIYYGIPFRKKRIGAFLKKCISIMQQTPYAAVHSHLNVMNGWILLAAKLAGIPQRISHSHDTYGKDGRGLEHWIHKVECFFIRRCSTHLLACTTTAGEYLYGEKLFAQRGEVILNGIDVEKFLNVSGKPKDVYIPSNATLVIGNISRFEAKKNQLFLLDVFAEILVLEPNAILLLGGVDGGQLDVCREKAKQLGITQNVQFIGVRRDMPQVLHLLDVYAFPSLYEGLGIVLLEAQAAGCYCVASTACPPDSDMGLGRIDYISLENDAKTWAQCILTGYAKAKSYPSLPDVRDAFNRKNYSISWLSSKMTGIYTGKNFDETK